MVVVTSLEILKDKFDVFEEVDNSLKKSMCFVVVRKPDHLSL